MMAGLIAPDTYINDNGTYKAKTISDDVCATGVKCVWRNSTCRFNHRPCVYGTINVQTALAVSSDVFFYRLGEQFFQHRRHACCRTTSASSASAPTPASTCRASSTGASPTTP